MNAASSTSALRQDARKQELPTARAFFLQLLDARMQQLDRLPKFHGIISRARASSRKKRFFVGIDGGICSGKSSSATNLRDKLLATGERVTVIRIDDYMKPRREREGLTHDEWFQLSLLARHLQQIAKGAKKIVKPTYSHRTGLPGEPEKLIIPENAIILVEGVYALGEATRSFMDLKIIFEADYETRFERWAERCLRRAGLPRKHTRQRFNEVTEPTYLPHLESIRASADVRINTDDFNNLQILFIKPELR